MNIRTRTPSPIYITTMRVTDYQKKIVLTTFLIFYFIWKFVNKNTVSKICAMQS